MRLDIQMSRQVKLSTVLDAPAKKVWALVKRSDTFFYVVRGFFCVDTKDPIPDIFEEGMSGTMRVRLFHIIPSLWPHHLRAEKVDDERMELQSRESEGPIRKWDHNIKVTPISDHRCEYTDTIDIDAGRATFLVVAFADLLFHYRHSRWRKLIKRQVPGL